MRELEEEAAYKILGVSEVDKILPTQMKENVRKSYYRCVHQVLNTELNSQNKMSSINSWAVRVLH